MAALDSGPFPLHPLSLSPDGRERARASLVCVSSYSVWSVRSILETLVPPGEDKSSRQTSQHNIQQFVRYPIQYYDSNVDGWSGWEGKEEQQVSKGIVPENHQIRKEKKKRKLTLGWWSSSKCRSAGWRRQPSGRSSRSATTGNRWPFRVTFSLRLFVSLLLFTGGSFVFHFSF